MGSRHGRHETHRRQGARGPLGRRCRRRRRETEGGSRHCARALRRARRRRSGEPSLCPQQGQGGDRRRHRELPGDPAGHDQRSRAPGADRQAQRRRHGSTAFWCSCRCRSTSTRSASSTPSIPARTSTDFTPRMSAGCGAAATQRWSRARPMAACCCCATRWPALHGAEAVVLGRSNIVGKPMAALLLAENCTVTVAHSEAATSRRSCAAPTFWSRPWVGRRWCAATGSSRAPSSSTSASTGSRLPAGNRRLVGDVAFAEALGRRRRDHPGAGRRRADDHRLPVAQYADRRLPAPRPG